MKPNRNKILIAILATILSGVVFNQPEMAVYQLLSNVFTTVGSNVSSLELKEVGGNDSPEPLFKDSQSESRSSAVGPYLAGKQP